MQVPMVHEKHYLVAQVIGDPNPIVGMNSLIQDLNGDVEEIGLYNFSYDLSAVDWLQPGTIMIIKEPRLRYGSYNKTPSIRVDSPSDVILVDPTDEEFLNKICASKWYVFSFLPIFIHFLGMNPNPKIPKFGKIKRMNFSRKEITRLLLNYMIEHFVMIMRILFCI